MESEQLVGHQGVSAGGGSGLTGGALREGVQGAWAGRRQGHKDLNPQPGFCPPDGPFPSPCSLGTCGGGQVPERRVVGRSLQASWRHTRV